MPELHVTLSKLHRSQNDLKRARQAALHGAEHFRDLAQSEPDDWEHRVQWARCELLADDHSTAIDVLEPLLSVPEAAASVRETLAVVYLSMFNQTVVQSPQSMERQLELLNQALLFGPTNPSGLALLARITTGESETGDGSDGTQFRDSLQRALTDGVAPAVVHLILGLQQLENGSVDRAVVHLELAQKSNPGIPMVLNGLAWGLTDREEPDLPRALSLIDAAARLTDDPQIRGTRAVVLDRLGRPADAVAELEGVLAEHPDPPWVHAQLADLYRRLGDAARADEHERQTEAIEEKSIFPKPLE
jgi:tetratricopeptide (TPR) repeat protein